MGVLEQIAQNLERIAIALENQNHNTSATTTHSSPAATDVKECADPAHLQPTAMPTSTAIADPQQHHISKELNQWLVEHRLGFDHFNSDISLSDSAAQLAHFIGTRYSQLADFLRVLYRHQDGKTPLLFNAKQLPPEQISTICHVAKELHNLGFAQSFYYKRAPECQLNIRMSGLPNANNFLNGRWLEQAISQQISRYHHLGCQHSRNLVVRLPSGHQRELDVLLNIGAKTYVIEAACGQWQGKLPQLHQLCQTLKLNPDELMLITPEANADSHELSKLHGLRLLALAEFDEWLQDQLDINANPVASNHQFEALRV